MYLALYDLQWLICHKPYQNKPKQNKLNKIVLGHNAAETTKPFVERKAKA